MAASGYTPILTYASGTSGNTPSASNLTSSSSGAELALNYYDGKLFYKDNTGTVQVLATKGAGTVPGSNTQVIYNNNGALGASSVLTFNGTTLTSGAYTLSTGNLTFGSTSQKFLADFTNATVASRLLFQTSTANSTTGIYAVPSGTATAASWQATNAADPTNASKILIATNGTTDVQLVSGINGTGTYLPLSFYTNGSKQAQLDTSGNFTLLNGSLTLSAGTANGVLYLNGSNAVTSGSALTFNGNTLATSNANASFTSGSPTTAGVITSGAAGTQGVIQFGSAQTGYNIQGGPDYTGLVYNVGLSSSQHIFNINGSEQMRLTSTGLGIGTSSPSVKLQTSGTSSGATIELLRLANTGSGANTASQMTFYAAGSNYAQITGGYGASSPILTYNVSGGGYQAWQNSFTEQMRLDTNGNLGLGVTPSAWSVGSGGHAFEFSNAGAVWNYSSSTGINLSQNLYYNGAYYYKNTAAATIYTQGAGSHLWYIAASGTGGTSFTPTQAMTLNNSGNLIVGGTSASNFGVTVVGNSWAFTSVAGSDATYNARFRSNYNYAQAFDITVQGGGSSYQIMNWGDGAGLAINSGSASVPIAFQIGGSEKGRFDTSGNLLVGTTSASAKLTVNGDASIHGLTVGQGAGSVSTNTVVGAGAFTSNTTGANNTVFGYQAGYGVTTGNSNVCIGDGAGSFGTALTTGSYNTYIGYNAEASSSGVSSEMVLSSGGIVGKGSSTTFVDGTCYNANNSTLWSVTSDQRLKKNIVDNTIGLSAVNQIKVRNFEYRLPDEITELDKSNAVKISGVQIGPIAQELQQVLPDCVKTESTGVMSVNSSNLIWHMVNAIQELSAQVAQLQSQLKG